MKIRHECDLVRNEVDANLSHIKKNTQNTTKIQSESTEFKPTFDPLQVLTHINLTQQHPFIIISSNRSQTT